ncbi:MAG: FtsW/RodA/SpoVE family cell cycle protein [Verrucomicrobia bacterium]|nr:FtsW/RodA/SpoVE family cell cycle protein [Verrucomicrobiota bacterium]
MKKSFAAILVSVLFLLGLGLVMLYSASYPYAQKASLCQGDLYWFVKRQIIWGVIGLVGLLIATKLDYNLWVKVAWVFWITAFIMLVLVLVPGFGMKINGARRWLKPGFQPSELGKVAVIFTLAWCLDRWRVSIQNIRFWDCIRFKQKFSDFAKGFFLPMGVTGMIVLPIMCETDVGTSVLIGVVGLCMMLLGGVRWWLVLPTYGVAGLVVFEYLCHDPVRWKRITDIGMDIQQMQAKAAFALGGIKGVGLGLSRVKEHYLPLAFSDFIAPIIGEELGLGWMIAMLLAFMILIAAGVYASSRAREHAGYLMGMGLITLIGLQALINLAVVTSCMPNKGMPLPFISYGGTDLCVLLVCVGVLLSIARHADTSEPALSPARRATNPFKARTLQG